MISRFSDPVLVFNIMKVLGLSALAFVVAFAWTPLLAHFLYKYKLGKQVERKNAPIFSKMHAAKSGTPTMGGILIWATVVGLAIIIWLLAEFTGIEFLRKINFLTRKETLLPLGALVITAVIGLVDDYLNVRRIGPGEGLRMRHRLVLYTLIAVAGAWWFYYKLDWDMIHVPGVGDFFIGFWYIPLFIFVIVATAFSVNEIDGLDGLAGGVLMFIFAAYGAIAFIQGRVDLAAFCAVIIGALLAFLWFNVFPARFFMGDTGAMSLGTVLGIIAMLTNSVLILPIIGLPLVLESLSVIIQLTSRKLFGKKVFLVAPLHHHFEAKGWPETKVTMRFWIIAAVSAAIGLVIGLVGRGN